MKWTVVLLLIVAASLVSFGMSSVLIGQGGDDYVIINRIVTLKERKDFFRTLTPERKSALWRKHLETELSGHPELTPAQKEVVNLAIVIASPDLFTNQLPSVCGPGSVFVAAVESGFKDAPKLRDEIFGQPAEPLPKFAHAKELDDWPQCECNVDSWCSSCAGCGCGAKWPICYRQSSGCGCFWVSECDSMCNSCP